MIAGPDICQGEWQPREVAAAVKVCGNRAFVKRCADSDVWILPAAQIVSSFSPLPADGLRWVVGDPFRLRPGERGRRLRRTVVEWSTFRAARRAVAHAGRDQSPGVIE